MPFGVSQPWRLLCLASCGSGAAQAPSPSPTTTPIDQATFAAPPCMRAACHLVLRCRPGRHEILCPRDDLTQHDAASPAGLAASHARPETSLASATTLLTLGDVDLARASRTRRWVVHWAGGRKGAAVHVEIHHRGTAMLIAVPQTRIANHHASMLNATDHMLWEAAMEEAAARPNRVRQLFGRDIDAAVLSSQIKRITVGTRHHAVRRVHSRRTGRHHALIADRRAARRATDSTSTVLADTRRYVQRAAVQALLRHDGRRSRRFAETRAAVAGKA